MIVSIHQYNFDIPQKVYSLLTSKEILNAEYVWNTYELDKLDKSGLFVASSIISNGYAGLIWFKKHTEHYLLEKPVELEYIVDTMSDIKPHIRNGLFYTWHKSLVNTTITRNPHIYNIGLEWLNHIDELAK